MVRTCPKAATKLPTIFVNVASYRDPECGPTVTDMLAKAARPDAITVGLVLQAEPEDHAYVYPVNVLTIPVKASESRGCCWARAMGYRLWDGEDYVLQIDSHMRFVQHWDVQMLAQLARCNSPRPLLTTYPPPYEPGQPLSQAMVRVIATHFGEDGTLNQNPRWLRHPPPPLPTPTALVAGAFLFGDARWIADVPYDPHLYYRGEESTLAARLWTHGWDMFGPTEPLVWHRHDDRSDGGCGWLRHWDDHATWWVSAARSVARANHLLAGTAAEPEALVEIEHYGLGTVRTLAAYREWSGIDFQARTLAPHALSGNWV